jgi:deoxyadenosine/deoxycytidine kinase
MAPLIIAVDGVMGSGKTTLLENLEQKGFTVIKEQTHRWEFLEKFYKNPQKYALAFQTEILLTFHDYTFDDDIVFVERCPAVNRSVFGKMLVADGLLTDEEMSTYINIYDNLNIWKPDVYVFIDCPTDIAMKRLQCRGDANNISAEYINKLQTSYEVFNKFTEVHKIDGTQDEDKVREDVLNVLKKFITS